ncbi:hypothetical protein LAWI1_G006801, partial [Lachnellula willkommii]
MRGSEAGNGRTRTCMLRPVAKPIPWTPMTVTTPAILGLRTHDLQSDESHAQPQADVGCSSTFINDEQHRVSRTSRSPSAATEALPVAEYQEWLFQGFLTRTGIGDDVTYNLEFKLAIDFGTLSLTEWHWTSVLRERPRQRFRPITRLVHQAPLKPKKGRAKWTKWTTEEDATLLQMKNDGCSWEVIHAALPHRSIGTIQGSVAKSDGADRIGRPVSEKLEPSSNGDDDDSSDGGPSEAEQGRSSDQT